jgi:hypothetical protein
MEGRKRTTKNRARPRFAWPQPKTFLNHEKDERNEKHLPFSSSICFLRNECAAGFRRFPIFFVCFASFVVCPFLANSKLARGAKIFDVSGTKTNAKEQNLLLPAANLQVRVFKS